MELVTSDYHFEHTKLREKTRPQFKTDVEMADYILKKYNEEVSKHDIVYFLGDMGSKRYLKEYIPKMNGTKVLILGNHDTYSKKFYKSLFDYVYNKPFYLNNRILLSHYPERITPGKINIHGHLHDIELVLTGYYNVCVDKTSFKPVRLKKFYDVLSRIEKPNGKFLHEWYKDYQKPKLHRDGVVLKENGLIDVQKSLNN